MRNIMHKNSILHKTLARALSIARPHDTKATLFFTQWLQDTLPKHLQDGAWRDVCGNLHIDARSSTKHRTLFVAHVDTVHKEVAPNKIRKTDTHWHADGAPLGADDGAGCAMLMHMLHKNVPGYYVFTQGEERGGIGATHLADHYPLLLAEFDRAIAFDRRGIDSVITHQGYGRCCSDTFAQHLADELNATNDNLMYLPDSTGVYTDTAEFTAIIPECTNISVGYDHEHSDRESLDILHFKQLSEAVTRVRWDMLPAEREPGVDDMEYGFASYKDFGYPAYDEHQPITAHFLDTEDAVIAAFRGVTKPLVTLMCESVYPEDPLMAERYINVKKLTDEVLEQMEELLYTTDPDTMLATAYDICYRGA